MKQVNDIPQTNPGQTNSSSVLPSEPVAPYSDTPTDSRRVSPVLIAILMVLIVILICVVLYFDRIIRVPWLVSNLTHKPTPTTHIVKTTPTPSPTPSFLPSGEQTYTISRSADAKGPRINSLTLNPLDAQKNQLQTITVSVAGTALSHVSVKIYADTSSYPIDLTLRDGVWRAQWRLQDSVLHRYVIVITATDSTGASKVIVAPRTPGPINNSEFD